MDKFDADRGEPPTFDGAVCGFYLSIKRQSQDHCDIHHSGGSRPPQSVTHPAGSTAFPNPFMHGQTGKSSGKYLRILATFSALDYPASRWFTPRRQLLPLLVPSACSPAHSPSPVLIAVPMPYGVISCNPETLINPLVPQNLVHLPIIVHIWRSGLSPL